MALKGWCSVPFEINVLPTLNPTVNLTGSVHKSKRVIKNVFAKAAMSF